MGYIVDLKMHTLDGAKLIALKARLAPHPIHLRQTLLDGAVLSFNHVGNPARFINTGNLLRELLRELFNATSPDEKIKRCRWYVPHPKSKSGVTRRHRTLFAVYSFLDRSYFPVDLVADVDGVADAVMEQVKVLSSFAHPTAKTVATEEGVAVEAFNDALALFLELLHAIDAGRAHVLDALREDLQQHLPDLFTNEFFDELDMLSTHTRPQDADDITVGLVEIGEEAIKFVGGGRVHCDMQYGSDGDCSRGDGLEWNESFEFKFSGEAPIDDPRRVSVEPQDVTIDTSAYHDAAAYE